MKRLIVCRLFIIFLLSLSGCAFLVTSNRKSPERFQTINVANYGVNGKDSKDDWESIQRLIDKILNQGGGTLYFPEGTYYIDDKTLLIWGSDLKLIGESVENTKIIRRGRAGWWGELLSVSGKSPGGKYYGGFGTLDYKRFLIYKGQRKASENIILKNLTLNSEIPYPVASNNIGVTNATNLTIKNCMVLNAPQSNLAIVNVTNKAKNKNIKIKNCVFKNSGQHNVRVISYNQGKEIGNSVIIEDSRFVNVLNKDRAKEIKGKKVHLWYRAGVGSKNISLKVENCFFDASGIIAGTVNLENFSISNSTIQGEIHLSNNNRIYPTPKIEFIHNQYKTNKAQRAIKSNTDYIIK